MKNYNEMASDVFRRIGEYKIERKRRRKTAICIGVSLCCVCIVTLLGLGVWRSVPLNQGYIENPNDNKPVSDQTVLKGTQSQIEQPTTGYADEEQEPQPEDASEPQPEDASEPQPEDVSEPQPEDVSESQPEDVSEPQPEQETGNTEQSGESEDAAEDPKDIFEQYGIGIGKVKVVSDHMPVAIINTDGTGEIVDHRDYLYLSISGWSSEKNIPEITMTAKISENDMNEISVPMKSTEYGKAFVSEHFRLSDVKGESMIKAIVDVTIDGHTQSLTFYPQIEIAY